MKTRLPSGRTAGELLDMYFLEARMHLLETASILDRVARARGGKAVVRDPRVKKLLAGARLLSDGRPDRAERFQRLFSAD
ncbi:MAG: hypothetical protein V1809_15145 [Planctomycetota bacterium]